MMSVIFVISSQCRWEDIDVTCVAGEHPEDFRLASFGDGLAFLPSRVQCAQPGALQRSANNPLPGIKMERRFFTGLKFRNRLTIDEDGCVTARTYHTSGI